MRRCARCDWHAVPSELPAEEQAVSHAQASGHWLCPSCGQSLGESESATCERCLSDARSTLSGIVTMYAELPAHLRTMTGSALGGVRGGSDGRPLPGGPVLSLLGPGAYGTVPRRLTATDVRKGEDGREHGVDNKPEHEPSVAWALASWEDDWRHTRGDEAAMSGTSTAAVVRGAARYLEVHSRWAANSHPAFDEYLSDIKALHARLETATHRRRRPVRAGADCFDCGGALVRRVDDDGLEEPHVTCTVCKQQYDPGRYNLALKAAAEAASRFSLDGIAWATPQALALEFGRSEHTIRSWAQRRQVASHVRAGVLFVDVDGVRQLVEAKGRTA